MARTPGQIIGSDALLQLIFEGYAVVPVKVTDAMREQMAKIADGPGRSYDEYWSMMVNTASGETAESD